MIFETEFDSQLLFFAVIIFGIIFLAVLVYLLRMFEQKEKSYTQALNLVFLKIEKNFTENPKFSEDFYNFLHYLKGGWFRIFSCGSSYLVLEMIKTEKDIEFYLGCQRKEKKFILDNFSKFWPDFKIAEIEPLNFFGSGEIAQGFALSLEKSFVLPIKTYNFTSDLFDRIFEIFQRSRGKTAMQILLKPTSLRQKKALVRKRKIILNAALFRLVKQKAKKPPFDLNIRFLSPAEDLMGAELNLVALKKLFEEIQDKNYNNLKVNESENRNEFVFNFVFRIFDSSKSIILNSEELATIFRF